MTSHEEAPHLRPDPASAYEPPRLVLIGWSSDVIRGAEDGHHLDEGNAFTYYHIPPNPYQ